jgi:phospholipase/lecithinase/hemolysin
MSRVSPQLRWIPRVIVVSCFLCALVAPQPALAQWRPGQVIVFGDSLSDPGNGFAFVKSNSTPPDFGMTPLLVPGAPYAVGGHHLTNGATWIEQLAQGAGLGRNALPAFASENPHAMNFAIGTARARQDGVNPSLALQVAAFLQKAQNVAPADALYVIQIGGNDVRDSLAAPTPDVAGAILLNAAAAVAGSMQALYAAGARQFLVLNVPDLGATPTVRFLEAQFPGTRGRATFATGLFNTYLLAAVGSVSSYPGIIVAPFDLSSLFGAVILDPALYGLTNVTDACVTPGDAPFTCRSPSEYLFWDGIHPTRAAHALVAQAIGQWLGF